MYRIASQWSQWKTRGRRIITIVIMDTHARARAHTQEKCE